MLCLRCRCILFLFNFFFFNDTATTEIYTLSLHDALRSDVPVYPWGERARRDGRVRPRPVRRRDRRAPGGRLLAPTRRGGEGSGAPPLGSRSPERGRTASDDL